MTVASVPLEATAVFAAFEQPVSIFTCDGTYLYVNPAGLTLIGKSHAEVIGKKYVELYPDLSGHSYHQAFLRVASGQIPTERLEFCYEPLGLWSSQYIYRAAEYVIVHWENITPRKLAEKNLERALTAAADSESLFRSMIEWMPQLAWCGKPDGFIDYYNPRWYEYTGTTPAEMVGWGWQSVHDPSILPAVRKRWEHSIATGESFEMEFPLRRHDGEFHWFLTRVRPMRNGAGEIIRWVGITTDIHDQKMTQAALERERTALKRLLRNVPMVINFLRGPELVYEVAHPLTVKALGREVEGMPLREVQPDDPDRAEILRQVFESGESRAGVEMLVVAERNGEPLDTYWNFTYVPVRDASGTINGVMTCEVEVTDQVRARKDVDKARHEAEIANRAKDEFLAMLGHELRNPLAPIQTALQLMRLQGSDAHERERSVIERQVTHLVRLVDDLLDVSRITRGKVHLTREHIEIAEIATRAVEMASPLFEKENHALIVEVPRYGLVVDVDPGRLVQALSNLLTNAAKYSPPGGTVTLAAQRQGDEVVITVADLGIGISPELLPKVFELFSQGQQAIDRAQGGLGLGLAIVRSLVELHGGQVSAYSEGRSRGSTFTIRLPAAVVSATGITAQRGPGTRASVPVKGMRVLVVDDNQDAADLLGEALQALGYVICVNYDGPSALAAAASFRPEVAILDIGLPVMDGYELAQRLRQQPELKGIRLIAVTGYGQRSDRDRALQAGFDVHLVKPVNMKALTLAIKQQTS